MKKKKSKNNKRRQTSRNGDRDKEKRKLDKSVKLELYQVEQVDQSQTRLKKQLPVIDFSSS